MSSSTGSQFEAFWVNKSKTKLQCLEKTETAWFIYKEWRVISTINNKPLEYSFWWNCLELS